MQEIIIIAAMAENRVIGKNNVMPWSIKEDMAHFTKLTKGWPCIMGRKTWDSLFKKPLPGRLNIVISRAAPSPIPNSSPLIPNSPPSFLTPLFVSSLQAAIEHCAGYEKIFICGGETIYRQSLDLANKIELTVVHKNYEGDTFFPEINTNCWKITNTEDFDAFSFFTYTKVYDVETA